MATRPNAAPSVLGRDRVHWLAATALIAVCNGISFTVFSSIREHGFGASLFSAFGLNPIFWFVLLIAAAIAFEPDDTAPLRRGDGVVAGIVLLLALVPLVSAASAGVLLAASWLTITAPRGSRGRRAGAVLLALTATLIWGPIILILFGDRLVELDGSFVAWLAGTSVNGNLVDFSTPGKPFMIAYGCSSMHNITMAIQLWVAVTQQLRIRIGWRVLLVGLVAIAANILVNGARIATIAHNREAFAYWHVGQGGSMFAWLAVFMVAIIVMLGCYALAPRRV